MKKIEISTFAGLNPTISCKKIMLPSGDEKRFYVWPFLLPFYHLTFMGLQLLPTSNPTGILSRHLASLIPCSQVLLQPHTHTPADQLSIPCSTIALL